VIVTTGNIPCDTLEEIRNPSNYLIEDPSQAWNALCIGGFTDKIDVTSAPELRPVASVGEHSPFSRTSSNCPQGLTPFKPDVVFEAGNRAFDTDSVVYDGVESLSLLTTGNDADRHPLDIFYANSAATAQAARMVGILMAEFPDFWPETIRALMIHSAEWTPAMRSLLGQQNRFEPRYKLVRQFGFGVPRLDKAMRSANGDLALISQAYIQPFKKVNGTVSFDDIHYYPLPWPKLVLENVGDLPVELKVTLSYFIEPSVGADSPMNAARYRSFGLRYDLKRRDEPSVLTLNWRPRTHAA